jgi:uncharacterized protein YuzE
MNFQYDSDADALEIRLAGSNVARTVQVDSGTLVDLDAKGDVVAIEVLRPSRLWPLEEILERFRIDEADAAVLRSLWGAEKPYPFAEPREREPALV